MREILVFAFFATGLMVFLRGKAGVLGAALWISTVLTINAVAGMERFPNSPLFGGIVGFACGAAGLGFCATAAWACVKIYRAAARRSWRRI